MPTNRPLETSAPESVEVAWREHGERAAVAAAITKYARVLDMTDSGRDVKPLVSGMFEAIDRLKELDAACGSDRDTPLDRIASAKLKVVGE